MINASKAKGMLLVALLALPYQLHAAPAQFEIDLQELDRHKPAAAQKPAARKPAKKQASQKARRAEPARQGERAAPAAAAHRGDYLRYTVQPGDHIFKILMAKFGMSNDEAERLIPEIVRVNEIGNIKALTVGRTLLIPPREDGQALAQGRKAKQRQEKPAEPAEAGRKEQAPRTATPAAPAPAPATVSAAAAPAPAPEDAAALTPAAAPVTAPAAPAPVKAPAPAPAPAPRPAAAPAPMPKRAPAPAPMPKRAPAPSPSPAPLAAAATPAPVAAPAPRAAQPVAAPAPLAMPQPATWICSVPGQGSAQLVDSLLNAISASWSKNRILQSGSGAPTAFSIRVDRYFEYKGERYIVSIGESDPYSYTLLRLLETSGYRVLRLSGTEDFRTVSEKLLGVVGVQPDFGSHLLGGKEATGYLIQQDDAGGRRVLVTNATATPGHKWVLSPGCGVR